MEVAKEEASKIFEEYVPYVYRTALLLSKSEALADDITQETFLTVFNKYHLFDTTKSMKPWIYKITVHTFRNMHRKQKWLTFIGLNSDASIANYSVESTILQKELSTELGKEIARLPVKSREMIVLYYYAQLKLGEIASVLGIPIGTCKSRMNRALLQLRRQLPVTDFYINGRGEINSENY